MPRRQPHSCFELAAAGFERPGSRTRSANAAVLTGCLLVGVAASGCRAESAAPTSARSEAFAPSQTVRVRKFGAVGDGRANDTAALVRALAASNGKCVDGE